MMQDRSSCWLDFSHVGDAQSYSEPHVLALAPPLAAVVQTARPYCLPPPPPP